ncbi:MAG: hypothetical protein Q8867_07265 [Bacteroidota bacterium]|nr:hypothetical protein [Bacteroidota bacterium]
MNFFLVTLNIISCFAGIWLLWKILRKFTGKWITFFSLGIIFLGTNYFQLVSGSSPSPVIYRFTLFALLIWLTMRWHDRMNVLNSTLLGLAAGTIILLNPSDFLVIFFPFIWSCFDKKSFLSAGDKYRKNILQILILLGTTAIPIILMAFFWHSFNEWFHYPGYDPQGNLHFPGLYLPQALFSWHNGWLVYTPVVLITVPGFYFLAKRYPGVFYATFGILFLSILIISSWSTYNFYDELGRKLFIPFYPLLALPVACFLNELDWKKGFPVIAIVLCLILLNLFQTFQFQKNILDPSHITGNQYIQLFGKTRLSATEIWKLNNGDPDTAQYLKDLSRFQIRQTAFFDFEDTTAKYKDRLVKKYFRSGSHSFRLDPTSLYTPSFSSRYGNLPQKGGLAFRISASVLFTDTSRKIPATLVITSVHKGILYRYRFLSFEDLKLHRGIWNPVSMNYVTPSGSSPDDTLTAYMYYRGKSRIYVDDLRIDMFEPRK